MFSLFSVIAFVFRNTKKILPLISLTTLAKILMEDSVVSKSCFLWTGYSICSSALNVLGKQVCQWKLHFHHWKFLVFLSIDHTQDCCPQVVHDRVPSIKIIENWKLLQMDYMFSIIILPAFGFYQQLELFTWLGSWPLTLFNSYYISCIGYNWMNLSRQNKNRLSLLWNFKKFKMFRKYCLYN